jgi:hypothetical protein
VLSNKCILTNICIFAVLFLILYSGTTSAQTGAIPDKDGYLNFIELGFPLKRVNHLNSTEVVGLIEKYKTSYLPSEIDFGAEKAFN